MKKLSILCSLLFSSVLLFGQNQTITIQGPTQATGPITVTFVITPPPTCTVGVSPVSSIVNTGATKNYAATVTNCPPAEDLLDWFLKTDRTVNHTSGTGNPGFNWLDADGVKFWSVKGNAGNPWDIYTYNGDVLCNYLTENGDENAFSNPNAYKMSIRAGTNCPGGIGIPLWPRYLVHGQTATISTPRPNFIIRTLNCELDGEPQIDIQDEQGTITWPGVINYGGTLGSQDTVNFTHFYGGNGGVYQSKETYSGVKGWGIAKWEYFKLIGGIYVSQQTTVHNTQVTGGSPAPNFPCYGQASHWVGGKPGVGGAASTPLLGKTPVTWSVNGVVDGNNTVGTVNQGIYTAPSTVPSPATVNVTATSVGDITKFGTSTATVQIPPPPPCNITISPTSATVTTSTTQQFTKTTTNCNPTSVNWFVNNISGGNSTVGTVNTSGLYTAPSAVPNPAVVTVKVVTTQDNITNATAAVTVVAPITPPPSCTVSITPTSLTVNVSTTQQFTATVTNCTPSTVIWTVNNIVGGNSTVGTVSVGGLYTAPATVPSPSTVTVAAKSNQDNTILGSAAVVVSNVPVGNGINNDLGCAQGDVPLWGIMENGVLLPFSCYYTNPAAIRPNGTVRIATDVASWVSVWNLTQCGDIVEVPNGTVFTSVVTIPSKQCDKTHYRWLRVSTYALLPPYNTRVTPCYAGIASLPGRPNFNCISTVNRMFKIQAPGSTPGLILATNSSYLIVTGAELTRTPGTGTNFGLVNTTAGGLDHIVWDHVYLHGDENQDETTAAFSFNHSSYHAVIDSFTANFYCVGSGQGCDAHPFGGGTNGNAAENDNTWKITDTFLEGSGQSILFGGGPAQNPPTDIEIRNNYLFKPFTWMPTDPSFPSTGLFATSAPITKNHFELKNGRRVLFEGNYVQNLWGGFSQPAVMDQMTVKNQAQGTSNVCPTCQVTDVTIRFNWHKTTGLGINIANAANGNGAYAQAGNGFNVHDNLWEDVGNPTLYKITTGSVHGQVYTDPNAPLSDVLSNVFENHNTFILSTTVKEAGAVGLSGPLAATGRQMDKFNWSNNLITGVRFFGINNVLGGCTNVPPTNCACGVSTPTQYLDSCFAHYSVGGNAIVANGTTVWPGANCLSEASGATMLVNFNNGVNGDYHIKPTSVCHNSGTDGTDPGARIDVLLGYINGVTTF